MSKLQQNNTMSLLGKTEDESKVRGIRLLWHYRSHFRAMAPASVIFVACGMRFAWSVFDTPTGRFLNNSNTHYLMLSLFLGIALGALLSTATVQRTTRNNAFILSGFILISAGILNIVLPEYFIAVCYSSIAVGVAYGLTHVQALFTSGEIAHRNMRGLLASSERTFVWMGILLQLLYTRIWYALDPNEIHLHIDQLHGIMLAGLGVLVVISSMTNSFDERIVFELENVNIAEDLERRSSHEGKALMFVPLMKILVLRCFNTLALSLPFNRAYLVVSWHGFECNMNCLYRLAFCGLLGSITGALLVDRYDRRKLCCTALFVTGIVIFLVGGVFEHLETSKKIFFDIDLDMIAFLMLLFEFVMSAGVAVPAYTYTAEAFPLATKARCIACILVSEQVLHIVLMLLSFHTTFIESVFFFTFGSVSLILGVLVFLLMPQTRGLTLLECLQKFKKVP